MEIIGDYGKKYKNGTEISGTEVKINDQSQRWVLSTIHLVGMIGLNL